MLNSHAQLLKNDSVKLLLRVQLFVGFSEPNYLQQQMAHDILDNKLFQSLVKQIHVVVNVQRDSSTVGDGKSCRKKLFCFLFPNLSPHLSKGIMNLDPRIFLIFEATTKEFQFKPFLDIFR